MESCFEGLSPGWGILPYISYTGMYRPKGGVWFLSRFGLKRVWILEARSENGYGKWHVIGLK